MHASASFAKRSAVAGSSSPPARRAASRRPAATAAARFTRAASAGRRECARSGVGASASDHAMTAVGGRRLVQVLRHDLVERVVGGVVKVEVGRRVVREAEQRNASRDHARDVGAAVVALGQRRAVDRAEQPRDLLERRLRAGPRVPREAVRVAAAEVRLERRDVAGELVGVRRGVGLAAGEAVLLVGEEDDADRPARALLAAPRSGARLRSRCRSPAPSSMAPRPRSQESRWAPSSTISPGSSRPGTSPMTLADSASGRSPQSSV